MSGGCAVSVNPFNGEQFASFDFMSNAAASASVTQEKAAAAVRVWLPGDGRPEGGCCSEIRRLHTASAAHEAPFEGGGRLGRLRTASWRRRYTMDAAFGCAPGHVAYVMVVCRRSPAPRLTISAS